MNAISADVAGELLAAAMRIEADRQVRAVVLHGGDKVFAAGADVKEMVGLSFTAITDHVTALGRAFDAIAALPVPVVAAVKGYALGGGLELAMTADVRFLADDAKVGQPEIKLGIIPGAGGTQRLPRLVGPSRARELVLTGRIIDAQEALRIGLADRVIAAEDVLAEAREWARSFVSGPARAITAAKRALAAADATDLATGLEMERSLFAGLWATDDQSEGMSAFVERRTPEFRGE